MRVVSRDSVRLSGGRIPGIRWASMDFPVPGGPIISMVLTKLARMTTMLEHSEMGQMKANLAIRPPMVISYLRFSRPEQLKGDSTRRQLDLSQRYAKERGWQIDKNLSDRGVSAFRGANAASGSLSKLLE